MGDKYGGEGVVLANLLFDRLSVATLSTYYLQPISLPVVQ
jgi:hypothetical protein